MFSSSKFYKVLKGISDSPSGWNENYGWMACVSLTLLYQVKKLEVYRALDIYFCTLALGLTLFLHYEQKGRYYDAYDNQDEQGNNHKAAFFI